MEVTEVKIRRKKKLGSYPYVSVVFSITLALFVIGLFGLLLLYANKLTQVIQENVEIQVFEISGTSESTYSNPENPDISQAEIAMEIVDVIDVSFDCHKIVKYGKVLINETIPGFNESLTGDFIDSDVDGCSDKVMIKNEQNFGYPYYF